MKYLLLSNLSKFLNSLNFSPISAAGSIPTSDKTEYLPPINSLCSTTSALYLLANSIKGAFLFSVIIISLFLKRFFEKIIKKFTKTSSVPPDFETTIKQEFFIFVNFL